MTAVTSARTRWDVLGAWPLFIGVGLLGLGTGLEGSLLGLRATLEGFPTVVTGVVMSAYYAGFTGGAVLAPRMVGAVGHIRVFAALASVLSAAALLHVQLVAAAPWVLLRLVSGVCVAGMLIVAESWLNAQASNVTRGRLLSVYSVVLMGGLGGGQLLLSIADPRGVGLFVLTSVLVSLALVPTALSTRGAPEVVDVDTTPARQLVREVPLGVVVSVGIGAAHGVLLGLGAVYAQQAGLRVTSVSLFLGITILGSVVLQFPLGAASDRGDRRQIILLAGLGAAGAAAGGALLTGRSGPVFLGVAGLFGGLSLPLYSLGIAHVNDYLQPRQRVAASATLVRLNGIGLAAGPLLGATGIAILGPPGFFWVLAGLHTLVATYAGYRLVVSPAATSVWRYAPLPARGAALAATAFARARWRLDQRGPRGRRVASRRAPTDAPTETPTDEDAP